MKMDCIVNCENWSGKRSRRSICKICCSFRRTRFNPKQSEKPNQSDGSDHVSESGEDEGKDVNKRGKLYLAYR